MHMHIYLFIFMRITFLMLHVFEYRVETMMFSKFVEEYVVREGPEILFFEESIINKLNRSSTVRTKIPTPFLDDRR